VLNVQKVDIITLSKGTLTDLNIFFPAKSGLPPRDTITLTISVVSDAATKAAAAPVLAPNNPTARFLVSGL